MQKKVNGMPSTSGVNPHCKRPETKCQMCNLRVYARNTSAWIHLNSIGTVMLEKLTFSNKPFHEGFQPDYCFHNIDTILILQCSIVVRRLSRFNHDEDCQLTTAICHSRPLFLDFRGISAHEALPWTLCVWSWGDRCLWKLEHSQAEEWMVWQHFADEVASGSNSWSWVTSWSQHASL